jgi:hypothetical protein
MRNTRNAGVSLPIEWMTKIDQQRGDTSRSRYILRLLEKADSSKEAAVVEARS